MKSCLRETQDRLRDREDALKEREEEVMERDHRLREQKALCLELRRQAEEEQIM